MAAADWQCAERHGAAHAIEQLEMPMRVPGKRPHKATRLHAFGSSSEDASLRLRCAESR